MDDRQVVDVLVAGPVELPAVDGGRRPDDLGRLEERAAVAVREPPDLPPHVLDVDVEGAVHGPAHDELVDARALPRRPHGRRDGLALHRRGVGEVPAVRRAGLRVRDREPRRLVGLDEDRGRDAVQERVAVRRALAVLVGHAQAQAARRCQRFRRGSSHAAAERQRAEAGGGQQGRPSPSLRRRRGRRRRTAAQGQRLLSERHQATPGSPIVQSASNKGTSSYPVFRIVGYKIEVLAAVASTETGSILRQGCCDRRQAAVRYHPGLTSIPGADVGPRTAT